MKNKELFDRANRDKDLELQKKLRNDFERWCLSNGRTPMNPISLNDWWNDEVAWNISK